MNPTEAGELARQEGCTGGLAFALLRRRGDALRHKRRQPAATFAVDPMKTDAVGSLPGGAQSAVADGLQGPHAPCHLETLSSTDHGRRSLALCCVSEGMRQRAAFRRAGPSDRYLSPLWPAGDLVYRQWLPWATRPLFAAERARRRSREQAFEIDVKPKPKAVPGRLANGTKLTAIKEKFDYLI